MQFMAGPLLKKTCASLCVALMFVFIAAAAASAVNSVQHAFGNPNSHEHMPFSHISLDDEDGHSTKHYGGGNGQHHHHGDTGTSIAAFLQSDVPALPPDSYRHSLARDSIRTDVRHLQPERPPRAFHTSV